MTSDVRLALRDWLAMNGQEGQEEENPEDGTHNGTGEVASDGLWEFEQSIRSFAGKHPDMPDGERRQRLLVAINGQIESRTALGLPIGRLYELRDWVQRDEL